MPSTITCPGCGAAVPEGLNECPHCNEMLAGLEPEQPVKQTVLPMVGAGLSILIGLGWGGIGLFQLAIGSLGAGGGVALAGIWNLAICALVAAGAAGLFLRKRWGFGICLWTAIINVPFGGYQVYSGAWLVAPIVLLCLVAAVILWMARGEFSQQPVV